MKAKVALVAVVLACTAGLSQAWQQTLAPVSTPSAPAGDAAAIARGARLAAVGDCIVCHTAAGGKPFAGGLPLDTPFGTLYSTNITPDRETGIGNWSLDAFVRAMRRGVSRDGHLLYPAFPYVHFTRMSDADIASVYAFMMSRDAVQASAPANKLIFPLNFRPLLAGWNFLYLHPGPANEVNDASRVASATPNTPVLDRGRYLVDSLGHCAACHTPLNTLGAEKSDAALQGGVIDGWDAPALTHLSQRTTPWTQPQLVAYLRTGFASEHGAAAGPMLPVTRTLADASDTDVEAIAAYLLSVQTPPAASPSPEASHRTTSLANQSGDHSSGAILFEAACASCHSATAPMSTSGGRPSLAQSTAVTADSPRNTVRTMLDGIGWNGSTSAHFMPPFAQLFTDAQIADLANYTRERYTSRAPWPSLDAAAVARIRKESPQP
jgi:mono/diheme cytochrome c family protein